MPTIVDIRTAMEEPDNNNRMLTAEEVANQLQFSTVKIQHLARNGEIRAYKIAGEWRFKQLDVDDYVERHEWRKDS